MAHTLEADELKAKWERLKDQEPKLRTRSIANVIGVSEAELVASACDGSHVVRLTKDWEGIFKSLYKLGPLMALTRNAAAVHEKTGIYQNISFKGHAGLVLDEQIDLRVFHKRWGFGFALPVENARGTLYSLQFFDKTGDAVHKIYLKDHSNLESYQKLVNHFKSEDQSKTISVVDYIEENENVKLEQVEADEFLESWSELRDTHDFYPMLRKFKLHRTDALKIAKKKYSWEGPNSAVSQMLKMASEEGVPIMVFVRNRGMIQIHSGPVKKINTIDNWINVLDAGFNLHLRQDLVESTWIVEKPTKDGIVTSLELFDRQGEQIATFFGVRKPGKKELHSWRVITTKLKKQGN